MSASLATRASVITLALLGLFQVDASASEVSPPATTPFKSAPKLTIKSPHQGSVFGKEAIVLDVAVDNFDMALPEPTHGHASPKPVGHIHIFLDSNPLIATNSRRIMFGTNVNGDSLPPGRHSITVELVHDNHEGFNPRILRRVDFEIVNEKDAVDANGKDESLTGTVH